MVDSNVLSSCAEWRVVLTCSRLFARIPRVLTHQDFLTKVA